MNKFIIGVILGTFLGIGVTGTYYQGEMDRVVTELGDYCASSIDYSNKQITMLNNLLK